MYCEIEGMCQKQDDDSHSKVAGCQGTTIGGNLYMHLVILTSSLSDGQLRKC